MTGKNLENKQTILYLCLTIALVLLPVYSYAENSQDNQINVHVKVNKSGNVDSVQIGDHGTFLTQKQINQHFNQDNNSGVSLNEFKNSVGSFEQNCRPSPKGCQIKGANQNSVNNLLNYMDNAAEYLAKNNVTFAPPSSINLGNNGAGDYSDSNTWNLSTTSGSHFKEVVTAKTIQTSLRQNYPNLGYTANEAFSRYFTYDCLGNKGKGGKNFVYNSNLENYSGNNIYQAYQNYNNGTITKDELNQIINNTSNNNAALFQAMNEIHNTGLVFQALQNLANRNNPNGQDVENAFNQANQQLNNGQNSSDITQSFNNHGI
jgi:hypothetical protein